MSRGRPGGKLAEALGSVALETRAAELIPRAEKFIQGAAPAPGKVKTYFDHGAFNWHERKLDRYCGREMSIYLDKKGTIRISSTAGLKLLQAHQGDGAMFLAIGIAPKALAIKLLPEGKGNIRARRAGKRSTALYVAHAELIRSLTWPLPVKLPAVWDEKSQMLVGKLPDRKYWLDDLPDGGGSAGNPDIEPD